MYRQIKNLSELERGDIVVHVSGGESYVVDSNYGDRVTGVSSIDITHPSEWLKFHSGDIIPIHEEANAHPDLLSTVDDKAFELLDECIDKYRDEYAPGKEEEYRRALTYLVGRANANT